MTFTDSKSILKSYKFNFLFTINDKANNKYFKFSEVYIEYTWEF